MKYFLTIISLALLLCNCTDNAGQKEIEAKINQLYANSRGIWGKQPDISLFSKSMAGTINNVNELAKADRKQIENSDLPANMPFMLEGSIFSAASYNGYDKYAIKKIAVRKDTAEAKHSIRIGRPQKNLDRQGYPG